jgi:hypothetical protein
MRGEGERRENLKITSVAGGPASWWTLSGIPSGVIVLWSGSVANSPDGWHLCNGTIGTSDLRDMLAAGAGTSYSAGNTGGSDTHTPGVWSYVGPGHTRSTLLRFSIYPEIVTGDDES